MQGVKIVMNFEICDSTHHNAIMNMESLIQMANQVAYIEIVQ
jgi:hypothetical protein